MQPQFFNEAKSMIIININEKPVKEKHICYYTTKSGPDTDNPKNIFLWEVYEAYYRHPDAPEHALIQTIETRLIKQENRFSISGASCVVLEAANNVIKNEEKLGENV